MIRNTCHNMPDILKVGYNKFGQKLVKRYFVISKKKLNFQQNSFYYLQDNLNMLF